MKRLTSATPTEAPFTLALTWDDGSEQRADLSGLVALSKHFKTFAETPETFARIKVINWGHGVEWENGLDYAAENLARIADAQTEEDGRALIKDFQTRFNLTNEQTGQALGYKKSQIKNFKSGASPLPAAARIAIHAMEENPTTLFARVAEGKAGNTDELSAVAP